MDLVMMTESQYQRKKVAQYCVLDTHKKTIIRIEDVCTKPREEVRNWDKDHSASYWAALKHHRTGKRRATQWCLNNYYFPATDSCLIKI